MLVLLTITIHGFKFICFIATAAITVRNHNGIF